MMRSVFAPTFVVALAATMLSAQAAQEQAKSDSSLLVYHDEEGIKVPELLPMDLSAIISSNCTERVANGTVLLDLVIDGDGKAQNISPLRPLGDDIDRMAVGIAKADHFAPGTKDGIPIAVERELEITLSICTTKVADETGKLSSRLRRKEQPVQKLLHSLQVGSPSLVSLSPDAQPNKQTFYHIGGGISAPVPIKAPQLNLKSSAGSGAILVTVIVDENGLPKNPRVVRGISKELDQAALEAVSKYRFKPAMKDKQPVAVVISIEVNFRAY